MSRPSPAISALVLAGGAARRLGGSKCGLDVGGQALLARSLAAATTASDDVLLLPGRRELPASIVVSGLRLVTDPPGSAGPQAALAAGLAAARHPWCLALACDLPFVSAALVARLVAKASPGFDAVAIATSDGLQPFPALYHTRLAARIVDRVSRGEQSLRGLLDEVAVHTLGMDELAELDPELRSLRNVNTPAELALARSEART